MSGGITNFSIQKTIQSLKIFELIMKYLIWTILIFFSFNSKSDEKTIIVLMYHRFNHPEYSDTSISKEKFEKQIKFLINQKIEILPLTDLLKYFEDQKDLPKKSVFITIDDAYKSFYQHAFPLLKKYKLPFSIFVSSKYISDDKKTDFMSWEMLKEITNNKGLVLNHSKSHKSFLDLEINELQKEVIENQIIINERLGQQPMIFSYPYGESSIEVETKIKEFGYKIAFSQHSSPISNNNNRLRLPRYSLNEQYGSMDRFKMILNNKPLVINNSSYEDTIVNSDNLNFSFKTKFASNTINCFINNDAFLKKENKEKNEILLKINNLAKGNRYRINCTHIDQNKQIYWFGKMIKRLN